LLMPHLQLVDKYGKENERQVAKFVLSREIVDRINWKNMAFDVDGFQRILRDDGQIWIHNALTKE